MAKYVSKAEHSPNFPAMEKEILSYWLRFDLGKVTTDKPAKSNFIFYDGPPFANGLPHYGHLLTGYAKDLIARFHTTLGARVERRFGWDCHGLPAEMAAEKDLGVSGSKAIEAYGVGAFNDHCASSVMKYANIWQDYVNRQGRWCSFENEYKTMDVSYMESVIWAFKHLYDKGLIYKDYRVMPYSWACETPLSNFETRLDDAYREKVSKTAVVSFTLKDLPPLFSQFRELRLLAWTTTPWTLPANLALAINPEMEYQCVGIDGVGYVAADIGVWWADICKVIGLPVIDITEEMQMTFLGSDLLGAAYEPLFPYFSNIANAFKVLPGSFVTQSDGTGIVHIAPGFGEDDFNLCKQHDIPVVCPINSAGVYTDEVGDLAGAFIFDSNDTVIIKLKESGNWIKTDQYVHNYPHCWRTDTPLIYKATPSWYVAASRFSERMVELSDKIEWVPTHSKAQFTQWLSNVTDWSISRNRFFGTPLPVWESSDPKYPRIDVYGSIEAIENDFGVKIDNLHRQYLDKLVRPNPDDPTGLSVMRRVPEVLDCWFESGSMPFASEHYPFNLNSHDGPSANLDPVKFPPKRLPADFIVEYVAQIRGWFYTLMALSTAIFDDIPFKQAICHGVVLDTNGKKLSKRLNNYVDPMLVMDEYGADALRFLMMNSPVMAGGTLHIDPQCRLVADIVRLQIKPIWNAYSFLITYANIDCVDFHLYEPTEHIFDRYIYIKLCSTIDEIKSWLLSYRIDAAYKALSSLFEDLDNWYIRRNKKRLWRSGLDSDKQACYDTLYTVLNSITVAMSPLLPFLAEAIYSGLNNGGLLEDPNNSVHMQSFPSLPFTALASDDALMLNMGLARKICNAALAVRNKNKIRVRQPLASLTVAGVDFVLPEIYLEIIKEEINVKDVILSKDLALSCLVEPKINFPVVGKRMPHKVKELTKQIRTSWRRLSDGRVQCGEHVLEADEVTLSLIPHVPESTEVLVGELSAVSLDLTVTPELWREGVARDVVRALQMSRQGRFDISDRIVTYLDISDSELKKACELWRKHIMDQTLSVELHFSALPADWVVMRCDIEEKAILIGMQKVI